MAGMLISDAEKAEFGENGVVVLRGFYDVQRDILPIQRGIYEIIGLVAARHGLVLSRAPFAAEHFDAGFTELISANRAYGGEVYDVVKQIPAFLRLIAQERNEALFRSLRDTDLVGIGAASYGIRIDNPGEERFRSQWHQEYLFQPQSMDGIVLWAPLVPVLAETGPVLYCLGSHRDGLRTCVRGGAYAGKAGAYQIALLDEEQVTSAYPQHAPLTNPGDVIVMDYLTIHQSGYNTSARSRWSMQTRYFNFREPRGMEIGWKASVTAGTDIEAIFADYFVEDRPL